MGEGKYIKHHLRGEALGGIAKREKGEVSRSAKQESRLRCRGVANGKRRPNLPCESKTGERKDCGKKRTPEAAPGRER